MAEAPTSSTVYQTSLPEYAEPYFTRLLQRAETESLQDYQPYTGSRLADFTTAEKEAMESLTKLGKPTEISAASALAATAGTLPKDALGKEITSLGIAQQYAPGQFTAGYTAPSGGITSSYTAGAFDATYAPSAVASGYQAGIGPAAYSAGEGPAAYQAGTLGAVGPFTSDIASRYMTPYQEAVTSAAVREIEKGAERGRTGISQAAAQAGGRGGYREALERAELQRNVLENVGDVTAKGRAAAYESAMQQYERDRQAQMAGFQTQEQARQAAAASGLAGYQAREQARQAAAASGLAGFQAQEAARQQQAQFGLTAQQFNEQQRLAGSEFKARQDAAREAARQQQAQFGLTAQQATEAQRLASSELAARQEAAREQARQQATQFSLAGMQQDTSARAQQLAAAQTLSNIGQTTQAMDIERLMQKEAAGQRARSMNQASLDIGYEDFLRQQGFTKDQLGFYSNILRGVPVSPQQTVSTFQAQPSLFQSVLGAGLSGLGLYNALKKGG